MGQIRLNMYKVGKSMGGGNPALVSKARPEKYVQKEGEGVPQPQESLNNFGSSFKPRSGSTLWIPHLPDPGCRWEFQVEGSTTIQLHSNFLLNYS